MHGGTSGVEPVVQGQRQIASSREALFCGDEPRLPVSSRPQFMSWIDHGNAILVRPIGKALIHPKLPPEQGKVNGIRFFNGNGWVRRLCVDQRRRRDGNLARVAIQERARRPLRVVSRDIGDVGSSSLYCNFSRSGSVCGHCERPQCSLRSRI
jgi:hypothetical protein